MIFIETKDTIKAIAEEKAQAVIDKGLFSSPRCEDNRAEVPLWELLAPYINLTLNIGMLMHNGAYHPYASVTTHDGKEAASATNMQPVSKTAYVDVITRALLPIGQAMDSQTSDTTRFVYSGGIYRTTALKNGTTVIWAEDKSMVLDRAYSSLDRSMMDSLAAKALAAMAEPEVILATCWDMRIQMEPTSREIARALILTELAREADTAWYCEEGIKALHELSRKPADSLDDYYDEQSRFMFSSTPYTVHACCETGVSPIVWDAYKVPHVIK